MIVRIEVIKVYDVDTHGGDTTDPLSIKANAEYVERMPASQIEREGKLVDTFLGNAEVVGPADDEELFGGVDM